MTAEVHSAEIKKKDREREREGQDWREQQPANINFDRRAQTGFDIQSGDVFKYFTRLFRTTRCLISRIFQWHVTR